MNQPIRVLIAEDQVILRDSYLRILEATPHITVLEAVGDGEAALEAAARLQPDVVLLDIQMPKMNGIEVAQKLRGIVADVGIVIFSHHGQRQYAQAFLGDGAQGKAYLLKTTLSEPGELVRAIEVVAEGGAFLAPEIQNELIQLALSKPNSQLSDLTKREMEVLKLIAEGYTNVVISQKLSVSERTVESHINNIYGKLGLTAEMNHSPRVMAVLIFLEATH